MAPFHRVSWGDFYDQVRLEWSSTRRVPLGRQELGPATAGTLGLSSTVLPQPAAVHPRAGWVPTLPPPPPAHPQGMLLPMGALNAHHNSANRLLFHPKFGYTLSAGSDPLHVSARMASAWRLLLGSVQPSASLRLTCPACRPLVQGWPLPDVVAAGKRQGVPDNDLHGAAWRLQGRAFRWLAGLVCRAGCRSAGGSPACSPATASCRPPAAAAAPLYRLPVLLPAGAAGHLCAAAPPWTLSST